MQFTTKWRPVAINDQFYQALVELILTKIESNCF